MKQIKLGEVDKRIVKVLKKDSWTSLRKISSQVNLSPSTVHERVDYPTLSEGVFQEDKETTKPLL